MFYFTGDEFVFEKRLIPIEGCFEVKPIIREDFRGRFIKTFHKEESATIGLPMFYAEEYYSTSCKGVLRGLHFQLPPADHEKLVYCSYGEVLDVVVDLRKESATYGQYELISLSAEKGNMLYIPKGLAHGFYVLSDLAVMMYKVTSVYHSECDSGILWDSVGIPWPDTNPIISERDRGFQRLADFDSPF